MIKVDKTELLSIARDLSALVDRITACCEEYDEEDDSEEKEVKGKEPKAFLGAILKTKMDKYK